MSSISIENLDAIFHQYDIRGLVGSQLDEDFFYALGKATVTYLSARNLVVGHDIRETSEAFKRAFIKGALEMGCSIKDIGMIPTELLYHFVGSHVQMDGGVVITASHNPKEWNGAKIVGKAAIAIGEETGLPEIKNYIAHQIFSPSEDMRGELEYIDPWPRYIEFMQSILGEPTRGLNMLVDTGNGIGGILYDKVLGNLPFNTNKLFFEPDSSFPEHDPNPKVASNLEAAIEQIKLGEYDLGFAFDGDADRVVFIDNQGRIVESAYIATLIAEYFQSQEPNLTVVHDPRIVYPLLDSAQRHNYRLVEAKSGRDRIKRAILEEKAKFGFENSGHFFYRDMFYSDSSIFTVMVVLKMVMNGLNLAETHTSFLQRFLISGEVNFRVSDPEFTINMIAEKYSAGRVSRLDGVGVDFGDWRFNLRKSNTEPLVRLNLEALNQEVLKSRYQELVQTIGGEKLSTPLNTLLLG